MDSHELTLTDVPLQGDEFGRYAFTRSREFPAQWWYMKYNVSSTSHCVSAWRDGVEVARCKFALYEHSEYESAYGPMPDGHLDILALEVALSARRTGVGRAFLLALRAMYPAPTLTALNDDAESRKFWDGVGWRRHEPKRFPGFSERVNYSEK